MERFRLALSRWISGLLLFLVGHIERVAAYVLLLRGLSTGHSMPPSSLMVPHLCHPLLWPLTTVTSPLGRVVVCDAVCPLMGGYDEGPLVIWMVVSWLDVSRW